MSLPISTNFFLAIILIKHLLSAKMSPPMPKSNQQPCLNMQMMDRLIKYALICIFQEQKSEHWMKPASKCLFNFVDILESEVFTEGILDFFIYHAIKQKLLSPFQKKKKTAFI